MQAVNGHVVNGAVVNGGEPPSLPASVQEICIEQCTATWEIALPAATIEEC